MEHQLKYFIQTRAQTFVRQMLGKKRRRIQLLARLNATRAPIEGKTVFEVWHNFIHLILYAPIHIRLTHLGLELLNDRAISKDAILKIPYEWMTKRERCDMVMLFACRKQLFSQCDYYTDDQFVLQGFLYERHKPERLWRASERREFLRDFFVLVTHCRGGIATEGARHTLIHVLQYMMVSTKSETIDPFVTNMHHALQNGTRYVKDVVVVYPGDENDKNESD